MAEGERAMGRASRYDAIIATLVGVCAVSVSAYTAWVQRQQVKAAVWPILEYGSSNEPWIEFSLANKGVGPAIIRRVVVKVDGEPVRQWVDALIKLTGLERPRYVQSTMTGRVLSAGETIHVLVPHDADGNPLTVTKGGPLWETLNRDRARVSVEICYCSTLGDCWVLRSDPSKGPSTIETRDCPETPGVVFTQ
jgi:hypothetical protein